MRLATTIVQLALAFSVLAEPQLRHVRRTTDAVSAYNGTTSNNSTAYSTGVSNHTSSATSTAVTTLAPSVSTEIFHPTSIPVRPWGPDKIPSAVGALAQSDTNGLSSWGTFHAPRLAPFITTDTTLEHGYPWGTRTANNTNPYTESPTTNTTRSYNFVVKRGTIAPDGVQREVLLINGQFPGPLIEANWGDTIEVTVSNELTQPEEGTAFHWHGLLQKATPSMDGVPGIQQCPIAPGTTFTYSFVADLYGTSWYHSHFSAQYAGGLFGPMIIHGPKNAEYDTDLGPVMLTDYYHKPYATIVDEVMGTDLTKIAPESVNNLINGKGDFNCSLVTDNTTCTSNAGLSKFNFTTGQTHRLRLINAGAEGLQKFSIDNHILTVIANDFVPVVPYNTTVVTLGIGQRTDVIVTANGSSSGAYWMRSTISSCSLATQPDGLAIIYYTNADTTAKPNSTAWTDTTVACANDDLTDTVPYYSITPPATPATTVEIDLNFEVNSTGNFLWTMNNSSFRVDYNDPILLLANQGNDSYPYDPEWNVYDFGSNSSIRIVINNLTPVGHPMHMHGHNMFVLDEAANATWDGTVVRPSNPQRRDVQLLQPYGYIAIQIDGDNPGVWPFHCHIAWHVSGGLYINILERPTDIVKLDIPTALSDTCVSWGAWTSQNVVDEIDSGL